MRTFLLPIAFVILSACSLATPFQDRGYGYVYWATDDDPRRLVVRKIGIIRDREGSPVRFEGLFEDRLLGDLIFFADRPRTISVRDDGEMVFVWLDGAPTANPAAVHVFDVARSIQRFRADEEDVARDAILTCDLETLQSDDIRRALLDRGIDPASDFVLSLAAFRAEDALGEFEPLGWDTSNAFAIRINTIFQARAVRGTETLASFTLDPGDLFMAYDTETSIPRCLTEAPGVRPEKAPYASSTTLTRPGRRPQIVIDGRLLYVFPASPEAALQPFTLPGTSATFFGPFD